jgi:hypothetical protein
MKVMPFRERASISSFALESSLPGLAVHAVRGAVMELAPLEWTALPHETKNVLAPMSPEDRQFSGG